MKTILVVNGEKYWQGYFPEYKVEQKFIQRTNWIIRNGELWVVDQESTVKPDGILWRVGAIKPSFLQLHALNMIEMMEIPCVNAPQVLKQGYDRLSMMSIIKRLGLPHLPFNLTTHTQHLKYLELTFPFVVKVGNYHGGFGKVLVDSEERWQDVKDMLFVIEDYIVIEPFIRYERDLRYIAIGDEVWAMSRQGRFWKANVQTSSFQLLEPEEDWIAFTRSVQEETGADIVALDVLEEKDGSRYVVEFNDIPGLSGFPDELKERLSEILKEKMEKA